ncbi:FecR family protein [Alistipes sp. OttesenSCG-928-L06]|nr:FecR family protein [Alistipes sp. OttesenSCG-928-L06]
MARKIDARKLLEAYMSGEMPSDVRTLVFSWLAKYGNRREPVAALKTLWDEKMANAPSASDAETEERFERYKKILGFPEDYSADRKIIDEICAGNGKKQTQKPRLGMLWRVAAVAVPGLLVVTTALWLLVRMPERPESEASQVALAKMQVKAAPVEPVVELVEEPVLTLPVVEEPVVETPRPNTLSYESVVSAPVNGHRYIRLPDNSTVLLNKGSEIAYSAAHREVYLKGEAFFDVAKGLNEPFRVRTDLLTVYVTGTTFNVNARRSEASVELVTGSVNVALPEGEQTLRPNDRLVYDGENQRSTVTAYSGSGWWDEPISFERARLSDILRRIEYCYDIRMTGIDPVADTILYTVKFDKRSAVEDILDLMNEWFEYRREGKEITIYYRETDK